MTYIWTPTPYAFDEIVSIKRGDSGTKVAALQLNLAGVTVDGSFGAQTDDAVRSWQQLHSGCGTVDGVAGGKTQASIIAVRSDPVRIRFNLPQGLLKSIAWQESSLYLAAYSKHPTDWGFDLGPYQNSIGPEGDPEDQPHLQVSYDVLASAERTAAQFRATYTRLRTAPFCEKGAAAGSYGAALVPAGREWAPWVYATQLAVLDHNWPGAADHLAALDRIFVEEGRDDDPQQWIIDASGNRLSTPREWVMNYIPRATSYVRWQLPRGYV